MRTFICNIVPNKFIQTSNASQATNNFCFSLIESNFFNNFYSIVPVSYYNNEIKDEDKIEYLAGNSNRGRFLRLFQFFFNNIKCANKAKKASTIWFYNICKANVICYCILRFIFRKQVFVILLDYSPSDRIRNIQSYIPFLYSKAKGIISVSERTSISHNNMQYKAGIIPFDLIKTPKSFTKKNNLKFLFSGCLGNHTGFPMALDIFKEMPDCELYISGNGKINRDELSSYKNIHYLGYLEYNEYLQLYDKIDVCLSLRDPNYSENDNNFPSKILEFFCYGKIVISTIKYPEINGFNYLSCLYDKNEIIKIIMNLQDTDIKTLNLYQDNRTALKKNFSIESWIDLFTKVETSQL